MSTKRTTTETAPHPRQALRPKEAAAALGISERTLWEWTREHGVPHLRIGNTVLYPVRPLDEWLETNAMRQTREPGTEQRIISTAAAGDG